MQLKRHNVGRKKGYALIEIAASYAAIVIVALITLRSTLNNINGQQWTAKQAMTDAFLTRETALASRIPFQNIRSDTSLWPLDADDISTDTVVIGKLPGGRNVTAELTRSRVPDSNNLASGSGLGTGATNPSASEAWKLHSVLSYQIKGKTYVKTRTTLRVR